MENILWWVNVIFQTQGDIRDAKHFLYNHNKKHTCSILSDKQLTIYDSYNVKCTAKIKVYTKLANISDAYSATNTMKFDTSVILKAYVVE